MTIAEKIKQQLEGKNNFSQEDVEVRVNELELAFKKRIKQMHKSAQEDEEVVEQLEAEKPVTLAQLRNSLRKVDLLQNADSVVDEFTAKLYAVDAYEQRVDQQIENHKQQAAATKAQAQDLEAKVNALFGTTEADADVETEG